MGTEPGPKPSPSTFLIWTINAVALLFAIAVIPKEGKGRKVAIALGCFEILLLVVLSLVWVLPRIRRSRLGWVVQASLAVAAVSLAVAGSFFLVIFVGGGPDLLR